MTRTTDGLTIIWIACALLLGGNARKLSAGEDAPEKVTWKAVNARALDELWGSDGPDKEVVARLLEEIANRTAWYGVYEKNPAPAPDGWTIGADCALLLQLLWQQHPRRRSEGARLAVLESASADRALSEDVRRWAALARSMISGAAGKSERLLKELHPWYSKYPPATRVVFEAVRTRPPIGLLPEFLDALKSQWQITEEYPDPPRALTSTRIVYPVRRAAVASLAALSIEVSDMDEPNLDQVARVLRLRLEDDRSEVWKEAAAATKELRAKLQEVDEMVLSLRRSLPAEKLEYLDGSGASPH